MGAEIAASTSAWEVFTLLSKESHTPHVDTFCILEKEKKKDSCLFPPQSLPLGCYGPTAMTIDKFRISHANTRECRKHRRDKTKSGFKYFWNSFLPIPPQAKSPMLMQFWCPGPLPFRLYSCSPGAGEYLVFVFWFLRHGFSMEPWLTWNSCKLAAKSQRSTCFCLSCSRIKGVLHYAKCECLVVSLVVSVHFTSPYRWEALSLPRTSKNRVHGRLSATLPVKQW